MSIIFEKFTDRSRTIVVLAQEEARMLQHNFIGTEHLFLGMIHEERGIAAEVLVAAGFDLDTARKAVREIVGPGGGSQLGHVPFTSNSKKVLELSLREALQLGHDYVGTEHLLLGLGRLQDTTYQKILAKHDLDPEQIRRDVINKIAAANTAAKATTEQRTLRSMSAEERQEALDWIQAFEKIHGPVPALAPIVRFIRQ